MATVLPEKITDITDEELFIQILSNIIGSTSREYFVIKDGFIYVKHHGLSEYLDTELSFIRLDDMQEIYTIYKKSLTEYSSLYAGYNIQEGYPIHKKSLTEYSRLYASYNIGFNYTRISGREYFKLGGSFTLINASRSGWIYESEDHIFTLPFGENSYIVQVAAEYFSVPNDIHNGAIKPYTPIKSIVKFDKLQKMSGEKYFKHEYNYRNVVDPYDANISFVCADTLDIVNPETGERVKTWKLILFLFSSWVAVKNDIETRNYIWPADIDTKNAINLLYDVHWKRYYILNGIDFYELRSLDSGKFTKVSITEAE